MKILYYIHTLGIGGAETIVVNYLLALKERGYEVVLVVNDEKDSFLAKRLTEENIRIIPLRPAFKHSIVGKCQRGIWQHSNYYQKRWNQILEKEAPDLFHIHTATNFIRKVNFPAGRMVYTFHGDVSRYMKLHGKKNFENIKELARKGMSFFSLSSKMSEDIRDYFESDRIEYIPNGVNIPEIRQKRYEKDAFLAELGLPGDAFLLGHVGRFHPVKNQIRVTQIFSELLRKQTNAYLVFVGDGHEDYLQKVKETVDDLELKDRVFFLGTRDDAVQIMSVLDALVLPSVAESFSLVLVEAQAQGIRAVASSVVPEEVICNDNCFRLDLKESNEKWADYLLGDFTESKERSIECFSMDRVIDRMIQCYQKLM